MYRIHYPYVMTIDADDFTSAAKRYVKMNRQYNLSQLIISDQFNNYKRALVEMYKENKKRKAKIRLQTFKPDEYGLGDAYEKVHPKEDKIINQPHTPAVHPQVFPGYQMNTVGMGKPLPPIIPGPDGFEFALGPY
jgi:hypothetical protein